MSLRQQLLNLLFPPKCPFCNRPLAGEGPCPHCRQAAFWIEGPQAVSAGNAFVRCACAGWYRDELRDSLRRFKFSGQKGYAAVYGPVLAQTIRTWGSCLLEITAVRMPFLRRVRQTYSDKTIWCFSGFTWEELTADGTHPRCEVTDEMLSLLDVLVDGRFVEELKDISLRFRGSSNQRLIDLNASRAAGHLCFLPDRSRGGR